MAQHDAPGLGLQTGFTTGEDGWGDDYNADMLKLSIVTQLSVINFVTDLPGSPTQGDIYILSGTDDSNSVGDLGQIAAWDASAWRYFTPTDGWVAFNQNDGKSYRYDSGWAVIPDADTILEIGLFIGGTMTADERVATFVATRSFALNDNFASSQAYAVTTDTPGINLIVKKNGTQIGLVVFTAATAVGVLDATDSNSAPVTFSAGDRLELFAPSSPGDWADIAVTIRGTK